MQIGPFALLLLNHPTQIVSKDLAVAYKSLAWTVDAPWPHLPSLSQNPSSPATHSFEFFEPVNFHSRVFENTVPSPINALSQEVFGARSFISSFTTSLKIEAFLNCLIKTRHPSITVQTLSLCCFQAPVTGLLCSHFFNLLLLLQAYYAVLSLISATSTRKSAREDKGCPSGSRSTVGQCLPHSRFSIYVTNEQ